MAALELICLTVLGIGITAVGVIGIIWIIKNLIDDLKKG